MVVRGPRQEEGIRQTPRGEGGEGRGVERERNGVKRWARASIDRRECGPPVEGPRKPSRSRKAQAGGGRLRL